MHIQHQIQVSDIDGEHQREDKPWLGYILSIMSKVYDIDYNL